MILITIIYKTNKISNNTIMKPIKKFNKKIFNLNKKLIF